MAERTIGEADTTVASLEQQVRHRIDSLTYLPTTTAVAMRFIELGKDPEAEPADYGKIISSDSSLSSKLLSLANSSWFGVRNKVTKPQTAVNLLGLSTVRTLAISYCLTGLHSDLNLSPEESRMFWSASVCKAAAARQYTQLFDKKMAEEAFTAGLFQDFAMPIMFAVAKEQFVPLLQNVAIDASSRLHEERALFQLDHTQVGRAVAQKLQLPELFVDTVAFHHNLDILTNMLEKPLLAQAVYVGSLFPHALVGWNRQDAADLSAYVTRTLAPLGLDIVAFLDGVQGEFNQIYGYFEQGSTPQVDLKELFDCPAGE